ncbi:hypothetical protein [Agrobacterium sp. CG674]
MPSIPIGEFEIDTGTFSYFDALMRKSLMLQWFNENYEDPWNSLSYDREDGFIWGDNGPFEAREVLEDTFGDIIRELDIHEVVLRIERKGVEWARVDRPANSRQLRPWTMKDVLAPPADKDAYWNALKSHVYDFPQASGMPNFSENFYQVPTPLVAGMDGDFFVDHSFVGHAFARSAKERDAQRLVAAERRARQILARDLADARQQLAALTQTHPRNHNRPPEELETDSRVATHVNNINITIDRLELSVNSERPPIADVVEDISRLRTIARWCGQRANGFLDGLAPGVAMLYVGSPEVIDRIVGKLLKSATHWLDLMLKLL